jgi:serine/threonine-protein kinase
VSDLSPSAYPQSTSNDGSDGRESLPPEATVRESAALPTPAEVYPTGDDDGSGSFPPCGSSAGLGVAGGEPVPGFRLISLLGAGGSGEVWKAAGPGGFLVALKLIPLGDEEGAVGIRPAGPGEGRSLELLRAVRHVNLLPLFGVWRRESSLVVGMELAERTLLDRCDEAVCQGQAGIPFAELIDYMQQAAQGIDFLNAPRHALAGQEGVGILHCDIKPQNLLLIGGTVKLGDFGLAQLLDGQPPAPTGGLTPAYAAPEFFQGRLSPRSDQYALALTYSRLRGGRLPFSGSPWEVILKHCLDAPDLAMLPEGERSVVARALAKCPEERWPSCRVFVAELRARSGTATRRPRNLPAHPLFLPLPPRPGRARRRRWWVGLLGLPALLLLVMLLLLLR